MMAYFSRLQKRARNESGWSGWKYTGSAASGADLVSEDTWCVVYSASVIYQGTREKISSLTLSTNFVNPLSSGNPCTVGCYLYSADPTTGGCPELLSPPPEYLSYASASFEASTVGNYVSFEFSGLDMRPEQLYFWFTSSVSYESFGSNSIYHYATGNYSASLDTGTRTPAISGVFSGGDVGGSDSGGGVEGQEYTLVSSGSYSSIFARRDFSLSGAWHSASCTTLSFTGSGEAAFSCCHGGEGDSFLQMRAYLTIGSGFDKYTGRPTGTVIASTAGGDSYSFTADVLSGRNYCFWTVIDYCGTETVPLNLSVIPQAWSYSISNKGSSANIAQSPRTVSMSMAAFQTGRIALSFAYSAGVDVTVSAQEGAFSGVVLVSDGQDIDNATGLPLEYSESFALNSPGSMFVEKGRTYYFFAIYNGGSEAGTLSFTVTPPPMIWTQGGSSSYSLLKTSASVPLSLGTQKYHTVKLSLASSGFLWLSGANITAGSGGMCVYVCEKDCFDSYFGCPADSISCISIYGEYETPVDLFAGKDYYLYVLNTDSSQSLKGTLKLTAPQAPESYSCEAQYYNRIESSLINEQYIRRYGYTLNTLSYKYRGETTVSLAQSQWDDQKTPHFRAYLCDSPGMDESSGLPLGTVLKSYTGKGESFSLSFTAEEDREYCLYILCEELYGGYDLQLELQVTAPPQRFFSITETGEYYGIREHISRQSAPGESGVLRLELSFAGAGIALIKTGSVQGTDCLMGWISATPYLDGLSGKPAQEIIKSAAGSGTEAGFELSFPVRRLESVYLFVRGGGIYDAANFELSVSQRAGAMKLNTQGGYMMAQPHVFSNGSWHSAMPLCYGQGSWHGG